MSTLNAWSGSAPPRKRLIGALLGAQICGSTAHSITLAIGSLVAAQITGTNAWSGLPVAVAALGAALASVPVSRLMGRFGRRPGLALGYLLGILGTILGMVGALGANFGLFLVGMTAFGFGQTANLLARYGAADVSPSSQRGRAISLIVWGSTAGSVLGPNLLALAAVAALLIGLPADGSPFLVGLVGYGLAALLVIGLLVPDPLAVAHYYHDIERLPSDHEARPARPLRQILSLPTVQLALGALMTGQIVMIGTTSTTAVYLHDHGHPTQTIGIAVSLHLAGMYAASPLAGFLADKLGRVRIVVLGALVLLGAVAFAGLAPGSNSILVSLAIFLNGVGWNFCFVAGSALLTDVLSPTERTSMQGLADLVIGLMGALGSATGGMVLQSWGFPTLNAIGALLVVGPLLTLWLGRPLVLSQRAA